MARSVYYTGTLITPDGTSTDIYGELTLAGHGATMTTGWVDPSWSRWDVYDNRDDVAPDTYDTADDETPAAWLARTVLDALGYAEDNGSWWSAVDARENYTTGASLLLCAHPEGFTDDEIAQASALILP